MVDFVDQVYIPDLLAIAPYYLEYAGLGEGLGNFLTWGEFPGDDINDASKYLVPRGVILGRDLTNIIEPDPKDFAQVQEFVTHAWYDYAGGDSSGLHPFEGETNLNYTGPKPPYDYLNVDQKYSWLKAPRWNGTAMEVGPLARVLMLYASGNAQTQQLTEAVLNTLNAPLEAVFSTLGRTAARGIETKVFADALQGYYQDLLSNIASGDTQTANMERWEPSSWPSHAEGFGFTEAPRGALGHWVVIDRGKISNYQLVVPTTWNASPRDAEGQPGAYEASLIGTPLAVPDQPLEILRTIHSFDPCMACAIHTIDAQGKPLTDVQVGQCSC
jgi:hydrogenase large subunit